MSCAISIYFVINNLVYYNHLAQEYEWFNTFNAFLKDIPDAVILPLINVVLFLFLKAYPKLLKDIESASTARTDNASSSLGTKLANLKTRYEQGLVTEEQYVKDRSEYIEKY